MCQKERKVVKLNKTEYLLCNISITKIENRNPQARYLIGYVLNISENCNSSLIVAKICIFSQFRRNSQLQFWK